MRKILVFSILALVLSSKLNAQFQEGYLVTADGDSLAGFVSYSEYNKGDEVEFKKQKRDERTTYTPKQVKAFGLSYTSRIVSLLVPMEGGTSRQIFIRQLVGGKMDLFVHKGHYFIRDGGEVYALLKDRNGVHPSEKFRGYFKDVLEKFFSGCISAENAKYEETSLRNLINNYNRCHRIQPIIYREMPRGAYTGFSVFAGAEKSDLTVNENSVVPTQFCPAFGASLTVYTPNLSDRLFFSVQGLYGRRSGAGFMTESPNYYRKIYSSYTLEFDMMRVPLGVGYYVTDPARSPFYLQAGISKTFILSSSFDYVRETESFTTVTTEAASHRNVVGAGVALWGSLGIQKRIHRNQKGFLEIRWENGPGSITTAINNYSLKITNVGLYAGLLF
jgi:hypothetical protein